MMKQLTLGLVLLFSLFSLGQNESPKSILITKDSTWLKEIITFPFHFAPNLNYKGYEDLRFAKQWSQPERSEFWSYVIAWNIQLKNAFTAKQIETHLNIYYDGLMTAVNKDKTFKVPKTVTLITENAHGGYFGKLQVYDAFHTKEVITLNVIIKQFYCTVSQTYTPVFWISHEPLDAPIWDKLRQVQLVENFCEL